MLRLGHAGIGDQGNSGSERQKSSPAHRDHAFLPNVLWCEQMSTIILVW
jgi:hypothetical protein